MRRRVPRSLVKREVPQILCAVQTVPDSMTFPRSANLQKKSNLLYPRTGPVNIVNVVNVEWPSCIEGQALVQKLPGSSYLRGLVVQVQLAI